jgi:hypothetical protein
MSVIGVEAARVTADEDRIGRLAPYARGDGTSGTGAGASRRA